MIGNERDFETFKTSTIENLKENEIRLTKHVDQKIAKIEKFPKNTEENEINNIKGELNTVADKLKDIESEISRLDFEYNQRRDVITQKRRRKSIDCKQCEENFESHSQLERHMEGKHVIQTIECSKCDKSFHTKWRLGKHQKIHDENIKMRKCHYYNSGKECPFEMLGCKFPHEIAEVCKYGTICRGHVCQYRHITYA